MNIDFFQFLNNYSTISTPTLNHLNNDNDNDDNNYFILSEGRQKQHEQPNYNNSILNC